jgi:predicted ribosomally synthesized peptide with nif11-like leader
VLPVSESLLQAFLQAVRNNPDLQEQLLQDGADPLELARKNGFQLSLEELNTLLDQPRNLADNALEQVAGGRSDAQGEGSVLNWCGVCNVTVYLIVP